MTTRRLRVLTAALVPWVATASVLAAPIGRPTPPPCAAEGACVPRRATWGYSETQWRLWPGTSLSDDDEAGEQKIGGVDVPDTDPPLPKNEDRLAPPTVDALEPEAEVRGPGDEAAPGIELPSDDEFEGTGQPAVAPDAVNPPLPPFMREGAGEAPDGQPPEGGDRPGGTDLPFGQPPADLFRDSSQVPLKGPSLGGDAPPPLPVGLRTPGRLNSPNRLPAPQMVLPASATSPTRDARPQVSLIPAEASQSNSVQQAGGDTPPAMPRGLFNFR